MKKIERIGDNGGNIVFVYESDLDELEQQRDELITLLIEIYDDWKYIDYYADRVKEMIEKIAGETWEEIKAGKR